ncbi:cupin [Schaalia odontolytica]|nr:cupin [Schaalia odontolytica]
MATLQIMTPLQPLMQASMKPPSPLRTPEQQPLKPTTPLQPKNALKTPVSHPQR